MNAATQSHEMQQSQTHFVNGSFRIACYSVFQNQFAELNLTQVQWAHRVSLAN
jgi:hypothetical protein